MSDTNYPLAADGGPDDLPRTLRRERDAREREARERQAKEREAYAAQAAATQAQQAQMHTGQLNAGQMNTGQMNTGMGHGAGMADPYFVADSSYAAQAEPLPAVVRRLDVPFGQLVVFFLKAVFAMVPALLLLGVILWGIGQALQTFFPQLVKMQILIWFPN
jgi:hypothetical protein